MIVHEGQRETEGCGDVEGIKAARQAGFDLVLLDMHTRSTPGSVAERWALLVLRTMKADHDPKTIATWAKWVGVSRSALCEYCRLIHVSAHDSRDFARLLRAIYQSGERWEPEAVLDFSDGRTLTRLLTRGGLRISERRALTISEFLERQEFIVPTNPGLLALRRWLRM